MPKSSNKNIGDKFGKLTIISITDKRDKYGRIIFLCKCDCGNEIEVSSHHLGKIKKSCGCLKRTINIGDKYGKLTVISISNNKTKDNRTIYKCKCDCGNETEVSSHDLGICVNSCGCLFNEAHKKRRKTNYPFMDEIREDYRQLIRNGEIKSNDKVPFWCDIDKEYYWQKLNKHSRQGCPKCGIKKQTITRTKKDYPFIDEIREDYQLKIKNGEISANEKVPFYCEKHGEYWKTLYLYEKSPGCPICNKISSGKKQRRTEYPFMYEIRTDYQEKIKNSEITCEDKVPFICDKHGEYWQNLGEHLYNNIGCPKCNTNISNSEQEVYNFIKEYYPNTVNNIRNLILNSKRELDIYIPELKIGIEYNGVIWHSEKFDDDKYNLLNKTKIFNNLGIRIIHIFEDEWYYKQDIVKKKLLHILNKDNSEKIYARNCIIKEISSKECKDFLDINHIQGNDNSKYRYGLFNNDNLVAVMTFKKNNKSIESKDWELSRYATSTTVIGGFNKLFNYAKNNIGFNKVITFADLRWSDLNNNIYEKTGWIKEYITKPNYFYVGKGYTRIYRFSMRKNILKDKLDYFDPNLTEVENCAVNGYYRLFDCGSIKYSKKYQS